MPAASTGRGGCGSGWTVRRWAATKATCHGSIGTTSTPRPRADRRDTRTYRGDTRRRGAGGRAGACHFVSPPLYFFGGLRVFTGHVGGRRVSSPGRTTHSETRAAA